MKDKLCMRPSCAAKGHLVYARGICRNCYVSIDRYIRAHPDDPNATWERLELEGLVLPSQNETHELRIDHYFPRAERRGR